MSEKIVCFETVSEELDPNGEPLALTTEEIAEMYFDRAKSYSRRLTTCTDESVDVWNERIKTMKTYVVKGDGFKYLVYDFMYVIDADTDEDGEVKEINNVEGFFAQPIDETKTKEQG